MLRGMSKGFHGRGATMCFRLALLALAGFVPARPAAAQTCGVTAVAGLEPLVLIGSRADEALRDSLLSGRCAGSMIRSSLSLSQVRDSGRRISLLAPTLTTVWNSRIPVTGNTGAMWAGRGWNASLVS